MEQDPEKLKAKGIYLGGVGLLLIGVAALVLCAVRVVSAVLQARMMTQHARPTSTYTRSIMPTESERTSNINEVVEFLVKSHKQG